MKKNTICILIGIVLCISFYTFTAHTISRDSTANVPDTTEATTPIVATPHNTNLPPIPKQISIFGEDLPLDRPDVYEALDREILTNTFWHTNTILVMKRAGRYFPIIEPILKEYNVPSDFKYLAVAESNLLPNAISPSKAVGLWQLLEGTAKELGLEVDDEVDQRYDAEMSTRAACKYLLRSYRALGSWTLVAAAYNCGQARVNKSIATQQQQKYIDLLWNEETSRYVFRIAAIKTIMSQPTDYGFNLTQTDIYQPYTHRDTTINTEIEDIATFAIEHQTTYKTLKILNPWLRQNKLTKSKNKEYTLRLPL